MTIDNQYNAASLFDAGWRASEKEELMEEYGLSESEADEICKELEKLEKEN